MSDQILKLRRSSIPGKIPSTSSLELGEIAINTFDGLAFIKKSGSLGEEIIPIGRSFPFTGSAAITGSLIVTGSITSTLGITGSLFGTASRSITSSATILNNTLLTNQTVGGVVSGTTFQSGSSLETILRNILVTYIPPSLSSLSIRLGGTTISSATREVGDGFNINSASFNAVADNPNGIFPLSSSFTSSNSDLGTFTHYFGDNVLSTSNALSIGSIYNINRGSSSGTVTFTVNGRRSDNNSLISGTSLNIQFLFRNYLAASSTIPVDNLTAQTVLNSTVQSTLASSRNWTATCTAANDAFGNFTYIIYPASYGNLSNIIQNGALSVISAFTNLGDFIVLNAFGVNMLVRIYKSNSDKAFASGTTLAIS